MKLRFTKICTVFLVFMVLSSCAGIGFQSRMRGVEYYEGPTPYVYEMHKLYDAVGKYAKKEFKFHLAGAGGEMMNGIHGMELDFQSDRELTEDEVMISFRQILKFVLDFANNNEIIREACDDKEMKSSMIRFFLINGEGNGGQEFDTVHLWRNKVTFKVKVKDYIYMPVKEVQLEQQYDK